MRSFLAAAALVAALPVLAAARQCSDPCLQAASSDYRECASSAEGAFLDGLGACLERDHECVNACRWTRRECRDSTGLGEEYARCRRELDAAKGRCRDRFPIGSRKRARCIDKAQVEHSRCRRQARRSGRRELAECAAGFRQCASACGVGAPPEGVDACKVDAKAAAQADLAGCKQVFQVTASGCVSRDAACVQACGDQRLACTAPTQATLQQALAACTAEAEAAIAACVAANPGGGTALDSCVETAQANATTCVDLALDAAGPGIGACVQPYAACVAACPKA